jgi:hypothetical protein
MVRLALPMWYHHRTRERMASPSAREDLFFEHRANL